MVTKMKAAALRRDVSTLLLSDKTVSGVLKQHALLASVLMPRHPYFTASRNSIHKALRFNVSRNRTQSPSTEPPAPRLALAPPAPWEQRED